MSVTLHEQYFKDHPDDDYWYYSPTLRALNPKKTKQLSVDKKPWPEINAQVG